MADATLSVEVVAELNSLTTGLDKATKEISKFVNTSIPDLKSLKQVLNNLGIGGVPALSTALTAQRVATEKARTALAELRAEQTRLNLTTNQGRAATEAQRTATEAQRTATEAQRTASANLRTQLAALRLANVQTRTSTTALSGSYDEANERLKDLGRQIRSAAGGFRSTNPAIQSNIAEYRRLNMEIQNFDSVMGNNQRRVGSYRVALDSIRGDLLALGAGYLSVQALMTGFQKVLSTNAEISDSLSDVRRTAGLTAVEAENLAEQLKKIDTRTSLKGLLDIATIGGQLGIAKDQLQGFTKAIDQLAVSLGGELKGGAEGVAKSLGVLDNVFKITRANGGDVEKSFNQIGSAILGLGQSGLATGDYLADFGERVGGVAKQAGLSLPVILSYGAVLQENGVSAEVAGTSFKKLIGLLATRRADFLTVAQIADSTLTMGKFVDVINNDTQKALALFFNGLQKGGKKTVAFQDILKATGLTMGGVSQAVSALAANQESLNSHIEQATIDFNEASLSAEQFALKNDNLAGSWEKLTNAIANATTKGGMGSFLKQGIDGIRDMIGWLDKLVNSRSWLEFNNRLIGNNAAGFDKANGLKDGLERNQNKAFELGNIPNLHKKNAEQLKGYYSEAKTAAINATVAYNTFKNAIKRGDLIDDGSLKKYKETADILTSQGNNFAGLFIKARANKKPNAASEDINTTISTKDKSGAAAKTTKEVKGLSDVLKTLNIDLLQTENQFGSTFDKTQAAKIKDYQKAINELIKLGYDPATAAVQELKDAQQGLMQLDALPVIELPELPKLKLQGGLGLGVVIDEELAAVTKKMQEFNESFHSLMQNGLADTLSGLGSSIGEALASGGNVLEAAGGALLKGFGSFLSGYGDLLIAYGAAAVLKSKLDAAALVPGAGLIAGPAAIAAGIALKIAGSAIGAFVSSGGSNSGSRESRGGGSSSPQYGVPHFANGGIVSGPTLAMVGEYPGAKHDPEIISPLSKLKSMMFDESRNTPQVFIAESRISGSDIYTSYTRTKKHRERGM